MYDFIVIGAGIAVDVLPADVAGQGLAAQNISPARGNL
jgi:hypothetical protein